MKKIWILTLFAVAVLMAGCGHKFTQKTIEQTIVKGKTTKKDVIAIFGEPQMKYTSPGMRISSGKYDQVLHKRGEVWIYSPHKYKFIDILEPEPLRIMFDDQGVVTNYDYKDDDD